MISPGVVEDCIANTLRDVTAPAPAQLAPEDDHTTLKHMRSSVHASKLGVNAGATRDVGAIVGTDRRSPCPRECASLSGAIRYPRRQTSSQTHVPCSIGGTERYHARCIHRPLVALVFLLLSCLCVTATVPAWERQALIDLYNATHGNTWLLRTNWFVGDPCENSWIGIVCSSTNSSVTYVCFTLSVE